MNDVIDTITNTMTITHKHNDNMYKANTDSKTMTNHNNNVDNTSAAGSCTHTGPKTNKHNRMNTTSTCEL